MNKRIGPFPTNGASKAACLLGLVCPVLLRCCGTHTPSLPTAVLSVESWMQAGASACFVMLERNGSKAQASSNDLRALMRGGSATCFALPMFWWQRVRFAAANLLRVELCPPVLRVSVLPPHTLHFFLHQNCPYPKPPPELPVLRIPLAGKSPTSPFIASAETRPRCTHSLGRLTPRPSQLRIFIRLWPRYARYLHLVGASSVATLSC